MRTMILFPLNAVLLCSFTSSAAQDAVPNGDFEQHSGCPGYYGQIDSTLFWRNPNHGTPDYFHECSTFFNTGVPHNGLGDQVAHSGVAYAGISLFGGPGADSREYIGTPLTYPLIANAQYHVELYANLGDRVQYTTDALQVYFSDTVIADPDTLQLLPFTPQVSNTPGVFFNEIDWTLVSGDYTAHGGESYLIIGNFRDDASTDTLYLGGDFFTAYTYIDDVSVTVATGMDDAPAVDGIDAFPNPFTDVLRIRSSTDGPAEVILYDITSRKVLQQEFTHAITIATDNMVHGVYLLVVRSRNRAISVGKVVKQ